MTGAVNSAIKHAAAILRVRFFSTWSSVLVTFAILLIAWKIVPPFVDWAFFIGRRRIQTSAAWQSVTALVGLSY